MDPDSNLFVPTLCEPYGILYVDAINCYMNERKKHEGIQYNNTIQYDAVRRYFIVPVIRGYWDGRYGFLRGSCLEPAECMFCIQFFGIVVWCCPNILRIDVK